VYTVKQVSERLGVSATLIYSLVSSGKLRCYRVGNGRGVIRISDEHVSAYLRETELEPEPVRSVRRVKLKHIKI
jgi:excisionase family DNA binding protein